LAGKLDSGNARAVSEEKQTILCILYNPLEPFLKVHAGHGTAGHDGPFVRLDRVQLKPLWEMSLAETPASKTEKSFSPLTCRTSPSVIDPGTSLLFLKTSRLAPMRRCSIGLAMPESWVQ
jgi:hypothetical protein